jgi:hypothetical protein
MKKVTQKIINLHKEKPVHLYSSIFIITIFVAFTSLALVKAFFVGIPEYETDIHTNIIYYNNGYLQDFKVEIPGTASFVINQSSETIFANIHETINASTTFAKVLVFPNEEKFIQAKDGYMILFTNASNTSTSTILVGKNLIYNQERLNALKDFLFGNLNQNPESLKKVYNIFAKIYAVDVNFQNSCKQIAYELGQKSFALYGATTSQKFEGKLCRNDFERGLKGI